MKQLAAVVITPAMTEEEAVDRIQRDYDLDYTSDHFPRIALLVANVVTATRVNDEARYQRERAQQVKLAATNEYDQAKRELEFRKAGIEAELLEAKEKVRELEKKLEEAEKNSAKDKMRYARAEETSGRDQERSEGGCPRL